MSNSSLKKKKKVLTLCCHVLLLRINLSCFIPLYTKCHFSLAALNFFSNTSFQPFDLDVPQYGLCVYSAWDIEPPDQKVYNLYKVGKFSVTISLNYFPSPCYFWSKIIPIIYHRSQKFCSFIPIFLFSV